MCERDPLCEIQAQYLIEKLTIISIFDMTLLSQY